MGSNQRDWATCVGQAEFRYNVATHLATKWSPFVVAYGVDVLQPSNLAFEGAHSTIKLNQDGEDLAKKHEQVVEITRLLVEEAQKWYEEQISAKDRMME